MKQVMNKKRKGRGGERFEPYQTTDSFSTINLRNVLEEIISHRPECLIWPLRKPIYGTAVHQTGKLPKSGTEDLTYRTAKRNTYIEAVVFV